MDQNKKKIKNFFNGDLAKERVLSMHVESSDSDLQNFDGYAGKSHAFMAE